MSNEYTRDPHYLHNLQNAGSINAQLHMGKIRRDAEAVYQAKQKLAKRDREAREVEEARKEREAEASRKRHEEERLEMVRAKAAAAKMWEYQRYIVRLAAPRMTL